PDLALAQRYQSHLSSGEESANENEGKDDQYVPADAVHVASLISAADRRGGCLADSCPTAGTTRSRGVRISLGSLGRPGEHTDEAASPTGDSRVPRRQVDGRATRAPWPVRC